MKNGILFLVPFFLLLFPLGKSAFVYAEESDVTNFVRQTYIHGIDYVAASRFGAEDVPHLLKMLGDPLEQSHWANIVITLSIMGDERVVDPLIAFFSANEPGILSRDHYAAKTSVLMSLGYVVNKNQNKKALNYLIDSIDPAVWTKRGIQWKSPFHASLSERNQQLTLLAIMGLALSGHPDAKEALSSTRRGLEAGSQSEAPLEEALRSHEIIASKGLAEYYRQNKRQ